jgi:hypothetical protein
MKSRSVFLCIVLFSLGASFSSAQTMDATKRAALRTLMEKSRIKDVTSQTMVAMIQQTRGREDLAMIPAIVWDKFTGMADSLATIIADSAIEVYGRYYTLEDVHELIKLSDNPVMQKSLSVTPAISTELAEIGRHLGEESMTALVTAYMKEDSTSTTPSPETTPPPAAAKKSKKR